VPAVNEIARLFGTSLEDPNWVWFEEAVPALVNLLFIIPTVAAPTTRHDVPDAEHGGKYLMAPSA
jgi:hypothetical protein